jgi:copper homeostasis protein
MPQPGILLEVAIASVEDALTAQAGGADRLELNSALELGGLTPSAAMIREVCAASSLPLVVLCRPRPGGFHYSPAEFRVLLADAHHALAEGATGIAFGVLHADGTIDRERVAQVVRSIGPERAVFHRAFDVTPDPALALSGLIDLGIHRVMSSGQQPSALAGADLLAEMIRLSEGRIEVLPAGGINPLTVGELLKRTGAQQVHGSLRASASDPSTASRPHVRFGATWVPAEDHFGCTSPDAVRQMRAVLG